MEEGPPRPRARRTFTARHNHPAVADLADVRRALEAGSVQVVDARPTDRFRGEAPEPRPGVRSGHMPGSRNVPFAAIVENGRLKDPAAIEQALTDAGVDPALPVITSCGSGTSRGDPVVGAGQLDRPAKALYDGSWAEWGSRQELPVATGPAETK